MISHSEEVFLHFLDTHFREIYKEKSVSQNLSNLEKAMSTVYSSNVSIFPPVKTDKTDGPEAMQTKPKAKLLELGHPSGRKECELLSKWVESKLKGCNGLKEKQTTYEFAIFEIIREVSINCSERGLLLNQLFQGIRSVHNEIIDKVSKSRIEEQAESKLLLSQQQENIKTEKAYNSSLQQYVSSLEKRIKENKEKEESIETQLSKIKDNYISEAQESKTLRMSLSKLARPPELNGNEREYDVLINTSHIDIIDSTTQFIFTGSPIAKRPKMKEQHIHNLESTNEANRMPICITERIVEQDDDSRTSYRHFEGANAYGKVGTPGGFHTNKLSISTFKTAKKRDRQSQTYNAAMSSRSIQAEENNEKVEMVSEEINQSIHLSPSEKSLSSLNLAMGARDILKSIKGGRALSNTDLTYFITPNDLEVMVREKLSLEKSISQLRSTIDELTEENDRLTLAIEDTKQKAKKNGVMLEEESKVDVTQISEEDKEFKNIDYKQYSNKNSKENSIELKKKQKKLIITTMAKAYIEKVLKVKKKNPELKDKPLLPLITLIRHISSVYSDIMQKYKPMIKDLSTATYPLKYEFCDYVYLYLTNKYGNTNQNFIKRKFLELLYSSLKNSKVLRVHLFLGFLGMTNDLESNDSAVYTKLLNYMHKL